MSQNTRKSILTSFLLCDFFRFYTFMPRGHSELAKFVKIGSAILDIKVLKLKKSHA